MIVDSLVVLSIATWIDICYYQKLITVNMLRFYIYIGLRTD